MPSYEHDLRSHPFFQAVNQNMIPILESFTPKLLRLAKEGKVRNTDEEKLFEHEWYDQIVWKYTSNLISGIRRLERSQIFLKTFPRPQQYKKVGIYQQDWNEYHYSYHEITLVSLFDIALLLTNFVFRLGIREVDCKPDLIMQNSWVKQTDVQKNLMLLKKVAKRDADSRNKHVHRGEVQGIHSVLSSESDAFLIDAADFVSSAQRIGEQIIDQELVDGMYRLANQELISQMQERTSELQSAILLLFDSLLPIYIKKSTELHNKWDKLTVGYKR